MIFVFLNNFGKIKNIWNLLKTPNTLEQKKKSKRKSKKFEIYFIIK